MSSKTLLVVALLAASVAACGKKAPAPSPSPTPTSAAQATPKPLPSPLPAVAAYVNGHEIPSRLVERFGTLQMMSQGLPESQRAAAYRAALEFLVNRDLMYAETVKRGIKVKDQDVEAEFKKQRAQLPNEDAWKAALAQQGLTPDQLRLEIRMSQAIQAMLLKETERITPDSITEAEARAYYDAHPSEFEVGERLRASHILLTLPPNADAQTRSAKRAKAEQLLARARKGEDFAKLARENSEDKGSAAAGGKLPEFGRGQTPTKAFEDAAFALTPGALSGVVETDYGFHIIKLNERVPSRKLAFEEVLPRLRAYLAGQNRGLAVNKLVAALRAQSKIDLQF